MRTLLTLFLLIPLYSAAQDYPACRYTYFKNGKVSTSQCFDADNRWGKARAFNPNGKVIYEKELRRIAGHSSVNFTFYKNGGVKEAEWSSAPDGGIQWYRSYTWFNEDGVVTREEHNNWDDTHVTAPPASPRKPLTPSRPKPSPAKQETMECAEIWVSEFWITNTAPYTVVVAARRKGNIVETHIITLQPRQSMKAGEMPGAQMFGDPAKYYDFSAQPAKAVPGRQLIVLPSHKKPVNSSRTTRRYYFDVRRII